MHFYTLTNIKERIFNFDLFLKKLLKKISYCFIRLHSGVFGGYIKFYFLILYPDPGLKKNGPGPNKAAQNIVMDPDRAYKNHSRSRQSC